MDNILHATLLNRNAAQTGTVTDYKRPILEYHLISKRGGIHKSLHRISATGKTIGSDLKIFEIQQIDKHNVLHF